MTGDRSYDEAREFFQYRFAQYLRGYGLLGLLFVIVRVFGQMTVPSTHGRLYEFTLPDFWAHVAAVVVCFAGWWYARGAPKPLATLEVAETAFVSAAMLGYAVMGYFIPDEQNGTITAYLALTMGLFARAIFVPSTARRSLIIGCAVALPSIALSYFACARAAPEIVAIRMESYHAADRESFFIIQTVFMAAWWFGSVAMTVGASKVIYGLRLEVRDAQKLGQYQLEDKLGEGGMGIVYRASHALLQRPTAVKLLPEDKVGDKAIARFEREVRLTAKLTHPNTITIFDYGRTPDGVFYYAMELLEGATLAIMVERAGPMAPARVARILLQIADALAEAHGIGLIHRDIKPANIMLCEQGGIPDTVKVLDFGLVKELDREGDPGLTQDVVTGTPQYMPPEALTRPDDIDARSDLYSFGAVAFFLLTGEHLFEGNTVVEICGHHLHTPPRRASELAEVPTALDDLVYACLAKDPSERPQSAADIVDRLESEHLADTWTRVEARAWWAEHGERVGVRELGLRGTSAA